MPEFFIPVAAEFEQSGELVPIDVLGPQHLGELAFPVAPPHLQLPHSVLGHREALREEQILRVLGINVRNAPRVAPHLDWFA